MKNNWIYPPTTPSAVKMNENVPARYTGAVAAPALQANFRIGLTVFLMAVLLLLTSCGGNDRKDKSKLLKEKQEALAKLQSDQDALTTKIEKLQKEIKQIDPNAVQAKRKLVALDTMANSTFNHFIDLQGKIDAQNVAYVAPKGQGGVVKQIYVKQGDRVSKGELLLKLDDASQRQSVIAAQGQVAGIKAQLEQAKTVFERQQSLWKENIGTELQVLNAKTALESLQSQYKAANANMEIAQEQVNNTAVRAAISGVINTLNVKVGEFFTAGNQIQIVNNDDLKVTINVPENYAGKIKMGSLMHITLPDVGDKDLVTKVNVVGRLIDPITRTFYIEGKVPEDPALRPGQVAMARIKDYTDEKTITIPTNTIQNDEKGKYVMVAFGQGDKMMAKKRYVKVGQMYHDQLQVLSGLEPGDVIISEGFQSLYDGQPIMVGL